MTHQKNINHGTITTDGNVHIGDNITYTIQERFRDSHSVLFLRLDPAENGSYRAMLSAKNAQTNTIDRLEQPVTVDIPASLFQQADAFQAMRRQIGGTTRFGTALSMAPEQAEATLADLLYETFFTDEIGALTGQFITLLQQRKLTELLLVISTDDDALLQLPWEMLLPRLSGTDALPPDGFGLIRSHLTTLDAFNAQGTTDRAAPLKVLFVSALPENMPEADKQLLLETELKELIAVSQHPTNRLQPPLVVEILDCANLTELTEALQKRSHDIVHISGHGTYLTDQQQGVLLMENEDGDQQLVTGRKLGEALRPFGSVKLVVVSACESAAGNVPGNVARQLADVGLPAVLAMRFSVTDEAARLVTRQFYGRLAAGDSLTKALHDTRHHLWQQTETRRQRNPDAAIAAEWFTPVLFQNQGIGPLIDRQRTYDTGTHGLFYPPLTFTRSQHTRLIGEDFIGRKRILIQLRKGFRQNRALCLHGMGGLGKTTTAEAFTNHYRTHHGNPPVLLFRKGGHAIEELSILTRLVATWKARTQPDALVADDLTALLDSPDVPTLNKLQAVIDNCLMDCPMILLFDNAEDIHDLEGRLYSESLRDFLHCLIRNVPRHCHILFTTRYAIADLADCLTHLPLGKMTYAEQYRYVQSSDVLRVLTSAEQALLYEHFDGLPRAFTFLVGILANGVAFNLSKVAEVESQLMENLLLDALYNSLTEAEQQAFIRASVLMGRFPVAALAHVMDKPETDLLTVLSILTQKTLCSSYDDAYEIHPLTRRWVQLQALLPTEEYKKLAQRAGQYYQALSTIEGMFNARYYFEQAQAWDEFAYITEVIANYYQLTGFTNISASITNEVLTKPVSPLPRATAINRLGLLSDISGNYQESLSYYNQSLTIYEQAEDLDGISTVLNNISQVYDSRGEYEIAMNYLEQSLSICQRIGNKVGEGNALNNIGQIYKIWSMYDIALNNFEKSLTIYQQPKDLKSIGVTLGNISQIYETFGDYENSLIYQHQSLDIRRQIGDKQGESNSLNSMSILYMHLGEHNLASNCLDQSIVIYKQIGDKKGESIALGNVGRVYIRTKNYDLALNKLEDSLKISKQIGDRRSESVTLDMIGQILRTKGDYRLALENIEASLTILMEIGDLRGQSAVLNNLANLKSDLGRYDESIEILEKSLSISSKLEDGISECITLNNIGQVYKQKGEIETSLNYLQKSLARCQQVNSIENAAIASHNIGAILCESFSDEKGAIPYLIQSYQLYNSLKSADIQNPVSYLNTIIAKVGGERFEQIMRELHS